MVENKLKQINIRVIEDEKERIAAKAEESGAKISDYIRNKLLNDSAEASSQFYQMRYDYIQKLYAQVTEHSKQQQKTIDQLFAMLEAEREKNQSLLENQPKAKRSFFKSWGAKFKKPKKTD